MRFTTEQPIGMKNLESTYDFWCLDSQKDRGKEVQGKGTRSIHRGGLLIFVCYTVDWSLVELLEIIIDIVAGLNDVYAHLSLSRLIRLYVNEQMTVEEKGIFAQDYINILVINES